MRNRARKSLSSRTNQGAVWLFRFRFGLGRVALNTIKEGVSGVQNSEVERSTGGVGFRRAGKTNLVCLDQTEQDNPRQTENGSQHPAGDACSNRKGNRVSGGRCHSDLMMARLLRLLLFTLGTTRSTRFRHQDLNDIVKGGAKSRRRGAGRDNGFRISVRVVVGNGRLQKEVNIFIAKASARSQTMIKCSSLFCKRRFKIVANASARSQQTMIKFSSLFRKRRFKIGRFRFLPQFRTTSWQRTCQRRS